MATRNERAERCRDCPMLNQYGFCETAFIKADRVIECPHDRMRRTITNAIREGLEPCREP